MEVCLKHLSSVGSFRISLSKIEERIEQFSFGSFNGIQSVNGLLTLRPPSTTTVPYANSLDPDETPSNSASHPDPSCLTLR